MSQGVGAGTGLCRGDLLDWPLIVTSTRPEVRLAEVVASLTLATDLATGQPLEHGLRRTLLAIWLGEALGLSDEDLSTTFYVALLGSVGCILEGAAFADYVRDEIDLRREMVMLDSSKSLQVAAFFLRKTGEGDMPFRRLRKFMTVSRQSQSVCRDVALQVGGLLDLGSEVRGALGQCDEHWNGSGSGLGLKGEEIHLAARLFILCHDVEVFSRAGGVEAAVAVVKERAGRVYDPRLAEGFLAVGAALVGRMQAVSAWEAVLDAEPEPVRRLSAPEFDDVARKIANFVDIRCPYTLGHSSGVAFFAEGAARALELSAAEAVQIRQAGLLHDLGRAGVAVSLWNKKGALSDEEWERMKRHPSLTELVLARSTSLGPLGTLSGLHHEKLDGSGYRGITASSLPVAARVLAVADTYQSKLEPRPHREALSKEQAAVELRREAERGLLDKDVVEAVLSFAGHPAPAPVRTLPASLSEREAEVLRLAVRGMSNREIAATLVLSVKTVGHHIESIYAKIGVSTRVGATLFAVQHGLMEERSPPAS